MAVSKARASVPRAATRSDYPPPPPQDFQVVKALSRGAYGRVFLARQRRSGDFYALKILRKAEMIEKNQVTNARNERLILSSLDNPFVVKLFYSFQTEHNLYLVMEYVNGGDCATLLRNVGVLDEDWARVHVRRREGDRGKRGCARARAFVTPHGGALQRTRLRAGGVQVYAAQVVMALEYLHSQNIVHRYVRWHRGARTVRNAGG